MFLFHALLCCSFNLCLGQTGCVPKCPATQSPIQFFRLPGMRFGHVHIDIVGPLPPCQGFTYLLTCVGRFTRWSKVAPMPNTTKQMAAKTFLASWVSRFGCPSMEMTDRARQCGLGPADTSIRPPTTYQPMVWSNAFTANWNLPLPRAVTADIGLITN